MFHHLRHIINERRIKIDEHDLETPILVQSTVIGEHVVISHHLILCHREQESVDILTLSLGSNIVQDAVQFSVSVVIGIKQASEIVHILHQHGITVAMWHLGKAVAKQRIGRKAER